MSKVLHNIYSLIFAAIVISGCSSTGSYTSKEIVADPYIGEIEKENFAYEGIKRNPVIVIHGFLGARLKSDINGQNYWGDFSATDAFFISDEKKLALAHPMDKDKRLPQLFDELQPNGMLKKATIRVFGIPIDVLAYENLLETLAYGGYVREDKPLPKDKHFYSLFEYSYDWRRDLPDNAKKLDAYIKEKRKYLQEKYKELYGIENYDVQFDVIAHSMGGLLSRYYLRYGTQDLPEDDKLPKITWEGSKYLDRFVIAGTPNAGYLDTFLEILHGTKLQPFPTAVLATLPTYYQMFPVPQVNSVKYSDNNEPIDIFDPEIWVKMKWGLVNPKEDENLKVLLPKINSKEERFEVAKNHLSKCLKRAEEFIKAMSIKATPPDDVKLYLIFGHGIKTSRTAYVNRTTGNIEKIEYAPGDGKVTTSSALYDERAGQKWSNFVKTPIDWGEIIAIRAAHMGILVSPTFQDNILFLLTMEETKKQKEILKNIKKDE